MIKNLILKMTLVSKQLVSKIYRGIVRCNLLSIPVIACVFFAIILRYIPWPGYWETFFEGWHLYEYWPLLILLSGLFFTLIGFHHHNKHGRTLFFPSCAVTGSLLLLYTAMLIMTQWAIDWSIGWSIVTLVILLIAIIVMVVGIIAYTEIWRLLPKFNSAVMETVIDALDSEQFQKAQKKWGSPHCLLIVQGYYEDKQQALLRSINGTFSEKLKSYFNAGENLISYLSLAWADEHVTATLAQKNEILREMITTYIWFRERAEIDKKLNPNDWIQQFRRHSDNQILCTIFELFESSKPIDVRAKIGEMMGQFRSLKPDSNQTEICWNSWLALAPCRLSEHKQAVFDVWMTIHQEQRINPFAYNPDKMNDISIIYAYVTLRDLYNHQLKLIGRARYVKEYGDKLLKQLPNSQEIWEEVKNDTQENIPK